MKKIIRIAVNMPQPTYSAPNGHEVNKMTHDFRLLCTCVALKEENECVPLSHYYYRENLCFYKSEQN